jgi:hypothetical protein
VKWLMSVARLVLSFEEGGGRGGVECRSATMCGCLRQWRFQRILDGCVAGKSVNGCDIDSQCGQVVVPAVTKGGLRCGRDYCDREKN